MTWDELEPVMQGHRAVLRLDTDIFSTVQLEVWGKAASASKCTEVITLLDSEQVTTLVILVR